MLDRNGTFFTESNTGWSVQFTTLLMDTSDTSKWQKYKGSDAVFTLGAPSVELFVASHNATVGKEKGKHYVLSLGPTGYIYSIDEGIMSTEYHGIYGGQTNCWLGSPRDAADSSGTPQFWSAVLVDSPAKLYWRTVKRTDEGLLGYPGAYTRPVVCMKTSVFNSKYLNNLVND